MRRLVFAVMLTTGFLAGQCSNPECVFTGQGWRGWTETMRLGYAVGFDDGYLKGFFAVPPRVGEETKKAAALGSCIAGMTYGQKVAIMDKCET